MEDAKVSRKAQYGVDRPALGRHYIKEWWSSRFAAAGEFATAVALKACQPFTGSTLSKIQNGRAPYQQWQLEAMAAVLGCAPADLLSGPPVTSKRDGKDVGILTEVFAVNLERLSICLMIIA